MAGFRLDYENLLKFVSMDEIQALENRVNEADAALKDGTGAGSDFTGWLDLPEKIESGLLDSINALATEIRENADVLVSVGIGGSYLGARAVIEAFPGDGFEIRYAGKNVCGYELENLLSYLEDKDFYINVISKSGTTTEPALAFRALRELAVKKYGEEYAKHVIATTDASKGALRKLSEEEGFRTFVIPDNVGGRFSVLTPVGLLPIACAGIDIYSLVAGARQASKEFNEKGIKDNPAHLYAAARYALYGKGTRIEILSSFDQRLFYLVEWWKQLFGESEGKQGKGLFPAGCVFSTDLHSLGQYIQDGERILMETFMVVERTSDLDVKEDAANLDGLNYLAGKTIDEINFQAYQGTRKAHLDGNVPNMSILIKELNPAVVGEMIYFFEKAVAVGGYLLDLNPFNQPGVEAYKKNMFELLGKPGY